jgi:excisionase family DNA binding protein
VKRPFQARRAQPEQSTRPVDSPYRDSEGIIRYLALDTHASPHSALYRLIKEHRLPHGRRGGAYLFDIREVDAWVKGFGSALEMVRTTRKAG